MGNVFKDHFATFPWALVDEGHLCTLSQSALRLYMVVLRLAQRHTAVEIELPAYEVRDYAGLDHKSVTKAGRELQSAGFIRLSKGNAGVTSYVLLNPESHLPLPKPEGRRAIRKHQPTPGRSARTAVQSSNRSNTRARSKIEEPGQQHEGGQAGTLTWDDISSLSVREQFPSMTGEVPRRDGKSSRVEICNRLAGQDMQRCSLSEQFSEEGISEQQGMTRGFECFVHGKKAKFSGPFCLACHPEAADAR